VILLKGFIACPPSPRLFVTGCMAG